MTDRERLDQIELYIVGMESSVSELVRDQSKMRMRIEKIESELVEIKTRLDKTLTYDVFDNVINSLLDRLSELMDLRKMSRKHESDIQRVEQKVDSLEEKIDNLALKMEKGFAMMFHEIQRIQK